MSTKKQSADKKPQNIFCTEYIHYRTGKLMRAADYGYEAWYFGPRKK